MGIKVVYNMSYGGFGLSREAVDWLHAKLADWPDTIEWLKCHYSGDTYHVLNRDVFPRHHPLLVQCVEELGAAANGDHAKLAIEEIEGNRYLIDEYDGAETVETPDSFCWIVVE